VVVLPVRPVDGKLRVCHRSHGRWLLPRAQRLR